MELNVNQATAAKVLGRSSRWLQDQPAPRNEDRTYHVPELVAWFVDRQSEPELAELKDAKLREEINVLKERNRKLQYENEATAGNLADIRLLNESLAGLAVPIRKLGETLGRKVNISGADAQQMLNQAIMDYERLLREQFGDPDDKHLSNR